MLKDNKNSVPISEITCSCGRLGLVVWSDAAGQFVAHYTGWQFKTDKPAGWYCGKPGHYQASFKELTQLGEMAAPQEKPQPEAGKVWNYDQIGFQSKRPSRPWKK